MKIFFLALLFNIIPQYTIAQTDTLTVSNQHSADLSSSKINTAIIPVSLITLVAIGKTIRIAKELDNSTTKSISTNFDRKYRFDDYLQYSPIVGVFALSNLGIKPKHSLKERFIVSTIAYTIMLTTVNITKYTTDIQRPDLSQANSFPSGHTATAFVGAEILWQEYKDENIWIGIAGYTLATTTGIMRVVNKKHWISDVVAGAGFGIMSAKIAYLLLPLTSRWFLKNKNNHLTLTAIPIYTPENKGGGISINLNF